MPLNGQLITLKGIKSAGIPGQARVDMDAVDRVAASIPSLVHSISARHVIAENSGLLNVRDRTDGKLLTSLQTSPILKIARDAAFNNHPTMDFNGGNAGLGFQPGKATDSYTVLLSINIDIESLPAVPTGSLNGTIFGLLVNSAWKNNTRTRRATTGTQGLVVEPGFGQVGSGVTLPYEQITVDQTFLVATSVDVSDKSVTVYKNVVTAPAVRLAGLAGINPIPEDQRADAKWSLGNALGTSGSTVFYGQVADFMVFNEPLGSSGYGLSKLGDLFAAMRTKYAIAA